MKVEVSEEAFYDVLDLCDDAESGETIFYEKSYEEGIKTALLWVTGQSIQHPFED